MSGQAPWGSGRGRGRGARMLSTIPGSRATIGDSSDVSAFGGSRSPALFDGVAMGGPGVAPADATTRFGALPGDPGLPRQDSGPAVRFGSNGAVDARVEAVRAAYGRSVSEVGAVSAMSSSHSSGVAGVRGVATTSPPPRQERFTRATSIAHVVRRRHTFGSALGSGSPSGASTMHAMSLKPVPRPNRLKQLRRACAQREDTVAVPCILVIVGVVLAALVLLSVHTAMELQVEQEFQAESSHRVARLKQSFTAVHTAAQSFASVFESTNPLSCTGACFHSLNIAARGVLEQPGLMALLWAPAIAAGSANAQTVSDAAVANGLPTTSPTAVATTAAGDDVCSPSTESYLAASLPSPPVLEASSTAAGGLQLPVALAFVDSDALALVPATFWAMFDLASCSALRDAVYVARDEGVDTIVALPWRTAGSGSASADERAVLVIVPVFAVMAPSSVAERQASFVGVSVAVASTFRIRTTSGSADGNEYGRQAASVWLGLGARDTRAALVGQSPLYGPQPHFQVSTAFVVGGVEAMNAAPLVATGNQVTVTLHARDSFENMRPLILIQWVAAAVTLATFCIAAIVYSWYHRRARQALHAKLGGGGVELDGMIPATGMITGGSHRLRSQASTSQRSHGSSRQVNVKSRLDNVLHVLQQVERVVPAYAARQISRVVATLRQPEDLFAVAPVDEARVLDTSHGWAQEGVLGGARRGSVSHARSVVPGSAHGMSVTMGGGSVRGQSVRGRRGMLAGSSIGTADNDSVSNRSVVDGPRPVFSWMPSAVSSPGHGTAATALSVTGGGSVGSTAPLHRLRAVAGMVASLQSWRRGLHRPASVLVGARLSPAQPPSGLRSQRSQGNGSQVQSSSTQSMVGAPPRPPLDGSVFDATSLCATDLTASTDGEDWVYPGEATAPGDSDVARRLASEALELPSLLRDAASAMDDLDDLDDYASIDMIAVSTKVERVLVAVVVRVFGDTDVLDALGLEESNNVRFAALINDGYLDVPYHTAAHAANVVWAVQHWCRSARALKQMTPVQYYSTVVAAAIHDYMHPGVNNRFLVATSHPIAIAHNDSSVLERFHVAEAFKVTMEMGALSPFTGLSSELHEEMRALVIELVLATDVSSHFRFIAGVCSRTRVVIQDGEEAPAGCASATMTEALKGVIMVSDIGHASAAFSVHKRWSSCIRDEFFSQGDQERAFGLQVSPLCDRRAAKPLAVSQAGFFDFVAFPLYKGISHLFSVAVSSHLARMTANKAAWKEAAASNASSTLDEDSKVATPAADPPAKASQPRRRERAGRLAPMSAPTQQSGRRSSQDATPRQGPLKPLAQRPPVVAVARTKAAAAASQSPGPASPQGEPRPANEGEQHAAVATPPSAHVVLRMDIAGRSSDDARAMSASTSSAGNVVLASTPQSPPPPLNFDHDTVVALGRGVVTGREDVQASARTST